MAFQIYQLKQFKQSNALTILEKFKFKNFKAFQIF